MVCELALEVPGVACALALEVPGVVTVVCALALEVPGVVCALALEVPGVVQQLVLDAGLFVAGNLWPWRKGPTILGALMASEDSLAGN